MRPMTEARDSGTNMSVAIAATTAIGTLIQKRSAS